MTKNRIRCPYCERLFDIEQMETADLFSERVDLAARLGRAWHLVNEYADCFAQSSGGRIGLKKRVRLIREVIRLWDGCTFELDGKRFKTTHENIMQAMTTVCNADKFGFKNHNYLKRVLESVEGSHLVTTPLERIHAAPNQSTRKRSLRDDLTDKSWAE